MLSQTRLIESSFPENCAKKLNAAICSLLTAVAVAQQQQTEHSVWQAVSRHGAAWWPRSELQQFVIKNTS